MMLRITEYRHTFVELDGVNTYVTRVWTTFVLSLYEFSKATPTIVGEAFVFYV